MDQIAELLYTIHDEPWTFTDETVERCKYCFVEIKEKQPVNHRHPCIKEMAERILWFHQRKPHDHN